MTNGHTAVVTTGLKIIIGRLQVVKICFALGYFSLSPCLCFPLWFWWLSRTIRIFALYNLWTLSSFKVCSYQISGHKSSCLWRLFYACFALVCISQPQRCAFLWRTRFRRTDMNSGSDLLNPQLFVLSMWFKSRVYTLNFSLQSGWW